MIIQPTRASLQRGARQLERLNLTVQRKQQIVIAHGAYLFWQPVVLLYGSKFSALSIGERLPWCKPFDANFLGVTQQQVLLKCCSNNQFSKIVDRQAGMFAFQLGFVITDETVELCRVLHLLIFSHAVFLQLVDGVATNTLAGFGVAFYQWGAL